jgi:hypothetical protein
MAYANLFENVKLKVLTEDLKENEVAFTKGKYDELSQSLKQEGGDLSATVQRSRQAQFKPLSNASALLDKAESSKKEVDKKKFLLGAQKQLDAYREDYGDKQDATGIAGNERAKSLQERLNALSEKS